ncbi:hypothetical protein BG842_07460 [Haladaptatus sp. W1]|uniref:HPP family protein n=1 Tax=unclassified Haladaptatus TaxID=2622732 RepID=UPI000849936C|nr:MULTISPECIES: HPP family protein [unclassified Haladaptatus]ODR79271.1 hypothetical protein BG842_07460 [Haladaptatus sp. W1]
MRQHVETGLYAGFLFAVLGFVAWMSGEPFIFPSLGPSAFVLAFERRRDRRQVYRIVGGHLIGGVAGFVAFHLLGDGAAITALPPARSAEEFHLVASAVVSIVLTSWAMIATDMIHAPACATTLIVSLGLLSTPTQVVIIVVSIVLLVASDTAVLFLFKRVVGRPHPIYSGE